MKFTREMVSFFREQHLIRSWRTVFLDRRTPSERILAATVSGDRKRADVDDQQFLVAEFDGERGADHGCIAAGISIADRFDYRMLGHRERNLVPHELDHEHDGGTGWPDWQPSCPG